MAAKRRGREQPARGQAVAFPRGARRGSARASEARQITPSRRSLLAGVALIAVAGVAYGLARETAAFAIRRVEISGAPPAVAAQVRHALAPLLGTSLVGLDGGALERRVEALPSIVSAGYDRGFPHTLRVSVVPERPVAVLRCGRQTWLVSAHARLIERISSSAEPALPRVWIPAATVLTPGAYLPAELGGAAAQALALADRFPAHIHSVSDRGGLLVFHLRSGVQLRLGDPTDIRLKLAVARRALAVLPVGSTYLDVALPGRPVAGVNPQVSGGA